MTFGSIRRFTELIKMITWTEPAPEHPYYPIPTQEEAEKMGAEKLMEFHTQREESIYAEKTDPFHNGYEPEHWSMADEVFASR